MRPLALHIVLALFLAAPVAGRAAGDAPQPLAKLPGPAGTAVEFSRDGKFLLTAGPAGARVWEAATYTPLTPLLAEGKGLSLARLSPDGRRVITLAGPEARLWDARTGEALRSIDAGRVRPLSAAFSPDGSLFAVGDSGGTARVCDAGDGRQVQTLRHGGAVYFAAFSPDSATVLCQSAEEPGNDVAPDRAYLWDARTGKVLWGVWFDDPWKEGREGAAAAFSGDGSRVATIHGVSDARTGERLCWFRPSPHDEPTHALAFSPDGRAVATSDNSTLRLLDAETGRLAKELERKDHFLHARSVCFSPDGTTVAAAGDFDGRGPCAALWDTRTGQRLMEVHPAGRGDGAFPVIAFSPDGRRVAAGFASDGFTGVWEVPGGKGR